MKPIVNAEAELAKKSRRNTAADDLKNLVGMKETKRHIIELLALYRIKNIAAMRGLSQTGFNANMVFTGNSGTGKTECARILARLLEEEGITDKNLFIECGRADIVAKYQGHTASNMKALIEKALGGVLFIDEAYSLNEGIEKGFGEEAVNTLLQEVENHKGELVVILAGYPKQMKEFIDSNPGLRSRFPNVLYFSDYSVEELFEISSKIAKSNGFLLDKDVKDKLIPIFNSVIKKDNFGNARFARNLVETAQLHKAGRLVMEYRNLNKLTNEKLFTLTAKDFEMPKMIEDCMERTKVGF